jgi:anti-sigma-K factor RskA
MSGGMKERGGEAVSEQVVRYLTGEMDQTERAAFEQRIAADPGLATEVEAMARVTGRLVSLPAEAWNPPEPPALDRAVFSGSSADPAARTRRGGPRRAWSFGGFAWPRLLAGGLAAAALFLGGALVGTSLDGEGPGPATTERLALSGIGPEAPAGAAGEVSLVSSGSDQLRLSVSGLKETGPREFYELWLLGSDGELVSLGSFRVDPGGSSEIEVPVPVDPDRYRYYDVSIQPENGSPDHSGRSVLRGLTEA